jgi:hypothetical protein
VGSFFPISTVLAQASGTRLVPVARGRFTSILLSVQFATSLGFLALAGLLAEGLLAHYTVRRGPYDSRILTAVLYLDPNATGANPKWGSPELQRLRLQLESALASIPGAASSAVALSLPGTDPSFDRLQLDGVTQPSFVRVQSVLAGPGLFEVLGVTPRVGRTIEPSDARPEAPAIAVVSQPFVDDVLGGGSPIGRRFQWVRNEAPAGAWVEIVGVVPDVGMDPGDRTARGEVFVPLVGTNFMYAAVRTAAAPETLAPALRLAVGGVDPRIRVTDVQSLADVDWENRAALAGGASVLVALGVITLLLSLAGIYSLASLTVTSRTREIGLRMALGATSADVVRTVLTRSVAQLGLGTIGGVVFAILLSRATAILPFSIPGSVGLAVLAAASILVATGVLASAMPVRRALRIDPMTALRSE